MAFNNAHLEAMGVPNLVPSIDAGELTGVNSRCPEDAVGNLIGVAPAEEYHCGDHSEFCRDLSAAGSSSADCTDPPSSGIICESECSHTWFQCAGSIAHTMATPAGTRCKGSAFVLEGTCSTSGPTQSTLPPTPTSLPGAESTAATTVPHPTTARPPSSTIEPPAPPPACGACHGCLWHTGECYADVQDSGYCLAWQGNSWCGKAVQLAAVQQAPHQKQGRRYRFLGNALLQQGVSIENTEEGIRAEL